MTSNQRQVISKKNCWVRLRFTISRWRRRRVLPPCLRFSLLLYIAIAVFPRCSLEHIFTISKQTQVVGLCSLHIYNSNFDKRKLIPLPSYGRPSNKMGITIDLARYCLKESSTELANIHIRSFLSQCPNYQRPLHWLLCYSALQAKIHIYLLYC